MPLTPNRTLNGLLTVAPSAGSTSDTDCAGSDIEAQPARVSAASATAAAREKLRNRVTVMTCSP